MTEPKFAGKIAMSRLLVEGMENIENFQERILLSTEYFRITKKSKPSDLEIKKCEEEKQLDILDKKTIIKINIYRRSYLVGYLEELKLLYYVELKWQAE